MAFVLFILYIVLSYIHPGEILPMLAPYRIAYWVGVAGLAVSITSVLLRRSRPLANLQFWCLIAFAALMGISRMVADHWLGAPIMALQRFGPSLTMFVLAMCSVTSLFRLRVTAVCVVALAIVLVMQGAAAYHLGANTRMFLLDPAVRTEYADAPEEPLVDSADDAAADMTDDDEEQGLPRIRGLGMMHDPNDLAMGFIVAIGLLGGAWSSRTHSRNLFLLVPAAALIYGVYLTRSRGGAVALVVLLWRFAAARVGRLPAIALLVALGAGVMALDFGGRSLSMQPDESASDRLIAWTEGLEMLKAQPLLGVGYGQFLDHHTLTAHNSLVLCFAETGLLGCFFWVGLLVITLFELQGLKKVRGDEPVDDVLRRSAEMLQLSLIGFMTAAFFLSRTFVPMLYLVVGLSVALVMIGRAAGRSIALPPLPQLGTLVLACEAGSIGLVYTIVKLGLV